MTHDKKTLSLERFPRPEKLLLKSQLQGRAGSPQGSPPLSSLHTKKTRLCGGQPPTPSLGIPGWKTWSFLKERADGTPSLLRLVSAFQETQRRQHLV